MVIDTQGYYALNEDEAMDWGSSRDKEQMTLKTDIGGYKSPLSDENRLIACSYVRGFALQSKCWCECWL